MLKIRYLHKTRREIPGIYARNPSIILQNMNFSRYYRYRAQLIYSFDLNIILCNYINVDVPFKLKNLFLTEVYS